MAAAGPGGAVRARAAPGTGTGTGPGPGPAPSRLPVRGARAKRPAAGPEAAAVPEQKRARPGPAASGPARPLPGGCRVPLRALGGAAGARAAPPRKAAAAAAAPRVAPPRGQPRALGQLERLRQELGERQQQERALGLRLGALEAELAACREESRRREAEAEGLARAKRRLEEEEERRRRALAEAEGRAEQLAHSLRQREEELQAARAAEELQTAQAADLREQVATLQAQVATQDQRLARQETRLHDLEMERRRLHNLVQELKGNIRVFCRVRPVLPEEEEGRKGLEQLHFPPRDPTSLVLCRPDEPPPGRDRRADLRYDFSFDRVFPPAASQREIFEEIALLVQSALDGYHVCIFAYGQTGSGKTYTMEGPDPFDPETRGVIPRAMRQIFQGARELAEKGWEYDFTASFLEIYNESIRDLLTERSEKNGDLEIRRVSSLSEELHVPNLRLVPVASEEEVLALLRTAAAHRAVARTALNDRSSRSHCVFQLRVRGVNVARDLRCSSVLSLVDLAGSERLSKSGARGERLREAQAINTSLSALGLVLAALANKEPHIPYRNSKLTYLLQNCLGGSAKMLMFVNISPLAENFNESLNSLRFASKVNECVVGTAHANRK